MLWESSAVTYCSWRAHLGLGGLLLVESTSAQRAPARRRGAAEPFLSPPRAIFATRSHSTSVSTPMTDASHDIASSRISNNSHQRTLPTILKREHACDTAKFACYQFSAKLPVLRCACSALLFPTLISLISEIFVLPARILSR